MTFESQTLDQILKSIATTLKQMIWQESSYTTQRIAYESENPEMTRVQDGRLYGSTETWIWIQLTFSDGYTNPVA